MRVLVCFPYAGAGASFFRTWSGLLGEGIQMEAPQLPGREDRFLETPRTSVDEAVSDILPEIVAKARGMIDITIFGHCLGAILGYELALRWKLESATPLSRLVVSAAHAPTQPLEMRTTGLDDADFLARIRALTGYSHAALEDADMRDMLLPVLKADIAMHEAYVPRPAKLIDAPITCVRGRTDEFVMKQDLAGWQECTRYPLEVVEMDGGHMYLVEKPGQLFDLLRRSRDSI